MLRIGGITLRRGPRVVLEDASMNVHPGHKVGLVGPNGSGKSSLLALVRGELHAEAGAVRHAAALGACPRGAGDPGARARGCRVRDRRRSRAAQPRGLDRARRGGARRRRAHRGAARAIRRDRRLPGARPCPDPACGARLRGGRAAAPGRRILRRLAHAPESRARSHVPLRSPAARRADQPPGPRCRALARGLAAGPSRARSSSSRTIASFSTRSRSRSCT